VKILSLLTLFMNASAEDIMAIPEFGEKMAKSVEQFFRQKQNRDTVEKLKAAGVNTVSFGKKENQRQQI